MLQSNSVLCVAVGDMMCRKVMDEKFTFYMKI